MVEKTKPRVFISYGRDDDRPFVEKLCAALATPYDFDVWWDQRCMPSRGRTFLLELRDAIEGSDSVVLVVGRKALESRYVRAELQYALAYYSMVVPALRDPDINPEDLPPFLNKLNCVDFRRDALFDKGLEDLTRVLTQERIPLGQLACVPALPLHYRTDLLALEKLFELTFPDARAPHVLALQESVAAIHGMPGSGKSVLAAALARSANARRFFQDGAVWLELGPRPNLWRAYQKVGRALDDEHISLYTDVQSARLLVGKLLRRKKCLLVLDDVWSVTAVEPFLSAIAQGSRILVTTRDRRVATSVAGERVYKPALLDDESSIELLAEWSGNDPEQLPARARKVAKACGNLPYPLVVCGVLAAGGNMDWGVLLRKLRKGDLGRLEVMLPGYPYPNVLLAFKLSFDALKPNEAGQYKKLAVFPAAEGLPEEAVLAIWIGAKECTEEDTDNACLVLDSLASKALLRLDGKHPDIRVTIHAMQHDALLALAGEDLVAFHREVGEALLAWWRKHREKPARSRAQDERTYIANHLLAHLMDAGQWDAVAELASDVEYLRLRQRPLEQHGFEDDFKALVASRSAPLDRILTEALESIRRLPVSREKADWLDTFAYWIGAFGPQDESERAQQLWAVAREFDLACGDVAKALADDFLKKGNAGWAMRFAELATWVYQRAGDNQKCVAACVEAESRCLASGTNAYRYLARAEFVRLRAAALRSLSPKNVSSDEIRRACGEIGDLLTQAGKGDWLLTPEEWQKLERDVPHGLHPPTQSKPDEDVVFGAQVVSNNHDCISAVHIIRFLESRGGRVEWLHVDEFKETGELAPKGRLLTVLIGGPKAPGISEVADAFYEADKDKFLRMYSGRFFEANQLRARVDGTTCCMLGGISKVNTLEAAYQFTHDRSVAAIIPK